MLKDKFDVLVLATMSAGKTSFINALIEQELLHTANEATTACITSVEHRENLKYFCGACYSYDNLELERLNNTTAAVVCGWNANTEVKRICLTGSFKIAPRPAPGLVLHDTPGPNNSQDEEHQRTTMGFIQDSKRNPLILYVLNASQLGTNDDRNLLGLVAETMRKGGKQSKDRFIFVINKMDVFDPENGEHLPSVLDRVKEYLTSNGIQSPLIYPVSANLTRLIRKPIVDHTRKERGEYSRRPQELAVRRVVACRAADGRDPESAGNRQTQRPRPLRLVA